MATKPPRVKVPKKAKKGDVIEIKTLITHDMETGNRKKDGKPIPRLIINKFECNLNGKNVFTVDLHPAISANPYISFFARATESGKFDFIWTDDNGEKVTYSSDITVS